MKKVFISHPFRNDPEGNMQKIRLIEKRLAALGIAYFSPLSNYRALEDTDANQRAFGLRCCKEWIPYCDELWLFGEWWKSEGCQRELATAILLFDDLHPMPIRAVIGWKDDFPLFVPWGQPEWLLRQGDQS